MALAEKVYNEKFKQEMFPVSVIIQDRQTLECVVYKDELFQTDKEYLRPDISEWPETFIWTEGNYACDCNRSIFFHDAKREDIEVERGVPCGNERYRIMIICGSEAVYSEFEDGNRILMNGNL